jgi:hypothetical protein
MLLTSIYSLCSFSGSIKKNSEKIIGSKDHFLICIMFTYTIWPHMCNLVEKIHPQPKLWGSTLLHSVFDKWLTSDWLVTHSSPHIITLQWCLIPLPSVAFCLLSYLKCSNKQFVLYKSIIPLTALPLWVHIHATFFVRLCKFVVSPPILAGSASWR